MRPQLKNLVPHPTKIYNQAARGIGALTISAATFLSPAQANDDQYTNTDGAGYSQNGTTLVQAPAKSPIINISYPDGSTRNFDCRNLLVHNDNIYWTKDALTAADINNTPLDGTFTKAEMTQALRRGDTKSFQTMADLTFKFGFAHFAQAHDDCVTLYVRQKINAFKKQHANNPALLREKLKGVLAQTLSNNGADWKTMTHCTMADIIQKARPALGLPPRVPTPTPDPAVH